MANLSDSLCVKKIVLMKILLLFQSSKACDFAVLVNGKILLAEDIPCAGEKNE